LCTLTALPRTRHPCAPHPADSSTEAKDKYKKKGSRALTAISMFPSTIRGSLIMNVALFTVEETILVAELVSALLAARADRHSAATDPQAIRQLDDLQKRKSPKSEFARCVCA
jgi:hypothetical protein